MKVRRKSWHYRFYNLLMNIWHTGPAYVLSHVDRNEFDVYWWDYTPKSLCRYFWATVGMALGLIPFIVFSILAVFIALIATGCYYVVIGVRGVKRHFIPPDPRDDWEKKQDKQPNMLVAYVKAKKGRYCPPIILID